MTSSPRPHSPEAGRSAAPRPSGRMLWWYRWLRDLLRAWFRGRATTTDPPGTRSDHECDLVMKGGITSGVAYPAAVLALHRRYRFRSIGGASAGAIAAAITAAAQHAGDRGGFRRLQTVREELQEPGLLPRLFQPTREARPLLNLFLAAQAARSGWSHAVTLTARYVGRHLPGVLLIVAGMFALLATLLGHAGGMGGTLDRWGWAALVATLCLTAALAAAAVAVIRLVAFVRGLPAAFYGMCIGKSEHGSEPALTEWLHERIQRVAEPPGNQPLTFADLANEQNESDEPDVRLRIVTTDLTRARPVRYPLEDDHKYLFSPEEWRCFFPEEVVAFLEERSPIVPHADARALQLRQLPTDQLPIVVATRMSLAFPVLLSAVPLWMLDESDNPVRHWMSDGGISSNFPIHFFDAWLPRRPTFGLNLMPTQRARAPTRCDGDAVHRYATPEDVPVRRAPINSVAGLLKQILDTMQNWRDTLQAELPGFHDRIVHIELARDEGGMNISMPKTTIACVDEKGAEAGERLLDFDHRGHWVRRYLGLMREVQVNLRGDKPSKRDSSVQKAFTQDLDQWLRTGGPERDYGIRLGADWYVAAADATRLLLESASRWLGADGRSFVEGDPPRPASTMRLNPDI